MSKKSLMGLVGSTRDEDEQPPTPEPTDPTIPGIPDPVYYPPTLPEPTRKLSVDVPVSLLTAMEAAQAKDNIDRKGLVEHALRAEVRRRKVYVPNWNGTGYV